MDSRPHLGYAHQQQNNKHMKFVEISPKGLTKRKMRWQKAPLGRGNFDENGEMAETFIAFLQGAPLAN